MAKAELRRWGRLAALLGSLIILLAPLAVAGEVRNHTRAEFDGWLRKDAGAKPEFEPGEVLGADALERVRPFLPPGYVEQLNFPEFRMEIAASRPHPPRRDFMDCTERYQPQVRLSGEGALAGYLCGQPFSDASLSSRDPLSGLKAAWNFDYRWQSYGQFTLHAVLAYERFGGSHTGQVPDLLEEPPAAWSGGVPYLSKLPTNASNYFGGGGTFDRVLAVFYQRMYFSHLAQRAASGGLLPVASASDFLWKEFVGFYSPFDVRGQVIISYRYADPNRADDAWAYDPKLRRVRRISVEVKSDSLNGSDTTQEDFDTFSGRLVRWNWKLLGWKELLCIMDSKGDYAIRFGPNGDIANDAWSLRRFAVVERRPKEPRHPYSSVIMFWDAENWHPWMSMAFNREGKLWKIWTFQGRWSEDFKDWAELNHGVQTTTVLAETVIDVQNNRATLFNPYGTGYPDATPDHAKRLFDVNKLEEIHR